VPTTVHSATAIVIKVQGLQLPGQLPPGDPDNCHPTSAP